MTVFPLKFRPTIDGKLLIADDAGGYFKSDQSFLERYVEDRLEPHDCTFLDRNGHCFSTVDDLPFTGFAHRWANRLYKPDPTDYVILVPTLRCNLACGYCQVSRVNENTPGFDWTEETLRAVLQFLDRLPTTRLKVEFQGGEPLLKLDMLSQVRMFCRDRFQQTEFVVCTNLQTVSDEAWEFLSASDTFISTSLDADDRTHQRQRTITDDKTQEFLTNLHRAVDKFGPNRVSALPTIDIRSLPTPESIIASFLSFGFRSIYLRPVNYQGFARKRFAAKDSATVWTEYHSSFIDALVEFNWTAEQHVEEYYFTHCLRRVLRSGHNGHADLRNPNILGHGYLVIDYDGTFYPTDEARMVTRIGQFDLSMGNVRDGLKLEAIEALNSEASNNYHPDCIHCPYQAFCGVDLVDDLSRYGRIDMPKHLTDFCQRHTYIFDKIFAMIYSDDPKIQKSVALWAGIPEFEPALAKVHL